MDSKIASIACIGIIGKWNNPLHIALFEPHQGSKIEFSLMLNSSLDILSFHEKNNTVDQDLGLLHALDQRFAVYGWITNTGVKFLIVVDMSGRPATELSTKKDNTAVQGLRDSDLKPAFRALQTAFVKLMQNPFYDPDDLMSPHSESEHLGRMEISNRQFQKEVNRVGELWSPDGPII